MKEETAMLKSENNYLLKKIDNMEQENRMNSLRIFNFKEKPQEKLNDDVIQLIYSKLGITIKHEDILEYRRIGKKSDVKPRCVLIKLANASVKLSIYNEKMLKGSKVVIKEDLSEGRRKLMDYAIEKTSLKNVWSFMGNIYVIKDNRRINVRCKGDVDSI
nr:unnamed protein product [Callosobruchus analis]